MSRRLSLRRLVPAPISKENSPMRKQIVSLAAAASLALVTISSVSAQVVGPALPLPAPPPAATAPVVRSFADTQAIAALRVRLAERGFDAAAAGGPMIALQPGAATPADFSGDAEMDAPVLPMQPQAFLVWTEAGRWWIWET